jgi:predicted transcriptional regulator
MASVPFPLRLAPKLRHRLEEAPREHGVSVEEMAVQAIETFLDNRDYKRREIAAAIAEADKGIFISSEAVERWMASWGTDNELPPPEPDIFPDQGIPRNKR